MLGHLFKRPGPLLKGLYYGHEPGVVRRVDPKLLPEGEEQVLKLFWLRIFYIVLVEPQELLRVEDAGGLADALQREFPDKLVHREYLLVACRPSEPREVVDERVRQIAHLFICHDGCRAVALGEPCLVRAEYHGQVREYRQLMAERLVKEHLLRSVVYVVVAPYDVGYVHRSVVHDYAEVIRRRAVAPEYDEVLDGRVVE